MSQFEECKKRQREIYLGQQRHRCLEPTAAHHRKVVEPKDCSGCPVRKFAVKRIPCDAEGEPIRGTPIQLPIMNQPPGYPECIYRLCKDDACKCSITELPVDQEICNRCNEEVRDQTAGSLTKIRNYWGAVRKWIAKGRPVRTDRQIHAIFETHCRNCERYDAENHACLVCGCKVNHDSKALNNKLKMATEGCPLGRFPAEV